MAEPASRPLSLRRQWPWVIGLFVAGGLWWSVRGIAFGDVAAALRRLTAAEIAVLLLVNLGITLLYGLRWWLLLRLPGARVGLVHAWAYRMAGFSISYLTPGTQFGGEPLQIALVQRRHAVSRAAATASVVIDRAVELLGNFTFLVFGLVLSLQLRLIPWPQGEALAAVAIGLLALPVGFLILALAGVRPLTWLLDRLPIRPGPMATGRSRLRAWTASTEGSIVEFCRRHPAGLMGAMGISLVSWGAMVFEYGLLLSFLEIRLAPAELIGVMTAGRLALLVPVPGGLGALEASQVLAMAALGYTRAEGLGLGLLLRARDMALAVVGLALGATFVRAEIRRHGADDGRDQDPT